LLTIIEMWKYLYLKKKLWLFPIFFVLIIIGLILISVQGSIFAPFIYPIF